MTLQDFLFLMDRHPGPVLGYFLGLPAMAWIGGYLHPVGGLRTSPLRWLYSALVYGAALPGLIAAVALADGLLHRQVRELGLLSEILPVLSMAATLSLVRSRADPADIPGFRRVTGFMLLLLVTAVSIFLLMQTRIWIFIGGGFWTLLISMGVLFLLLKWAFERAFGP